MNPQLLIVFSIVALDAVGIGLIFPILPSLLQSVTHAQDISIRYGVILALYATMQFVFSPVLGAMSDRFGRRPVLLTSIGGATVDYLFMALSPAFWVLLVGRAIAGVTSANMAVATAYIADITEESDRAKRFGYMSAAFGVGFIIGPVLGGVLGQWWVRAPFFAAAVLNAVNLALTYFMLPESRAGNNTGLDWATLNPLAPMKWAFSLPRLLPLLAIFVLFGLIGNIPGTVWVLYGVDKFHWSEVMVGLSLAVFGICHAGAQAGLTGPITKRFGDLRTIVIGICFDSAAFIIIGLATRGWVAFALGPMFALGGVAVPGLQSLLSNHVDADHQGELQGVLASVTSLTAIIGPLLGTAIYSRTRMTVSGAVWFTGAAMYLLAAPLLLSERRARRAALPSLDARAVS